MRVPTCLLRCKWPPNAGVLPGDLAFDALLSSIKKDGIKEPLTINLKWYVIDGCHRLSAARMLDIKSVEVRIWTGTEMVE